MRIVVTALSFIFVSDVLPQRPQASRESVSTCVFSVVGVVKSNKLRKFLMINTCNFNMLLIFVYIFFINEVMALETPLELIVSVRVLQFRVLCVAYV